MLQEDGVKMPLMDGGMETRDLAAAVLATLSAR